MMFQDPYASLNPRKRVADIIAEPLEIQGDGTRSSRRAAVAELLDEVGLPSEAATRYPHEFSGGQRQRIGFARALAVRPKMVIADEPVSALDVSIQAQILNLMEDLRNEHGLSYIFISHDLAVVRYIADRIGVMYLGKLVEVGRAGDVFSHPAHHYTQGLLDAVPIADVVHARDRQANQVRGRAPERRQPPVGLPVPDALPRGDRGVRRRGAGVHPGERGPPRGVPPSAQDHGRDRDVGAVERGRAVVIDRVQCRRRQPIRRRVW